MLEAPVMDCQETGVRFAGSLKNDGIEVEVLLRFSEVNSPMWRPRASEGRLDATSLGLVIAQKAAEDLGVSVGDTITMTHPVVGGPALFSLKDSQLPGLGIHPDRKSTRLKSSHKPNSYAVFRLKKNK